MGKAMNAIDSEWRNVSTPRVTPPSLEFIRAVASILESNSTDLLAELGFVAVQQASESIPSAAKNNCEL